MAPMLCVHVCGWWGARLNEGVRVSCLAQCSARTKSSIRFRDDCYYESALQVPTATSSWVLLLLLT